MVGLALASAHFLINKKGLVHFNQSWDKR